MVNLLKTYGKMLKMPTGYSKMQFKYNGIYYAVELLFNDKDETTIQLYNSQTKDSLCFINDDEFKNNSTIDGKLLKDIWDQTIERD